MAAGCHNRRHLHRYESKMGVSRELGSRLRVQEQEQEVCAPENVPDGALKRCTMGNLDLLLHYRH